MGNIKAKFQLLDNYIKKYSMEVNRKIQNNEEIEIDGQIGFGIVNISKTDELIGEIELTNEIVLKSNGEEIGTINVVMGALFQGDLEIEKEEIKD